MTPKQTERAAGLVAALRKWPLLAKSCNRTDGRGGIELTVDVTGKKDRPTYITSADVDRITGRKVLRGVRKIIEAELRSLGVRIPARR